MADGCDSILNPEGGEISESVFFRSLSAVRTGGGAGNSEIEQIFLCELTAAVLQVHIDLIPVYPDLCGRPGILQLLCQCLIYLRDSQSAPHGLCFVDVQNDFRIRGLLTVNHVFKPLLFLHDAHDIVADVQDLFIVIAVNVHLQTAPRQGGGAHGLSADSIVLHVQTVENILYPPADFPVLICGVITQQYQSCEISRAAVHHSHGQCRRLHSAYGLHPVDFPYLPGGLIHHFEIILQVILRVPFHRNADLCSGHFRNYHHAGARYSGGADPKQHDRQQNRNPFLPETEPQSPFIAYHEPFQKPVLLRLHIPHQRRRNRRNNRQSDGKRS